MAIEPCPECKKDVSSQAEKCPSCAFGVRKHKTTKQSSTWCGIIPFIVGVTAVVGKCQDAAEQDKQEAARQRQDGAAHELAVREAADRKKIVERFSKNKEALLAEINAMLDKQDIYGPRKLSE